MPPWIPGNIGARKKMMSNRIPLGPSTGGVRLGVSARVRAGRCAPPALSFCICIPPPPTCKLAPGLPFPCCTEGTEHFCPSIGTPFSLLPNSALCEALFWVASTRPPGSAAITLSRSSAPHLPMPSPPPARAPSMVAPSQSVPSSSFPSCPSTRMPPPPRTPSPPVSRSLAAFPGALAEPP